MSIKTKRAAVSAASAELVNAVMQLNAAQKARAECVANLERVTAAVAAAGVRPAVG